MKLNKEEKQATKDKIDVEGFDYFFRDYSDCEEIKDKEFHKRRKTYIKAANDLETYLE